MSYSSAISGLNAFSRAIDVTGNNIANANTVGFKTESLIFSEKLSQNISNTSSKEAGTGVDIIAKRIDFTQGSIESSGNTLDLAIRGEGFFPVQTVDGTPAFSRSGQFTINKDDYITDLSGNYLMGLVPDGKGSIVGSTTDRIRISRNDIVPGQTQKVSMGVNLSANDKVITKNFDPEDTTSYGITNSINAFDSLGIKHILRVYYRKVQDSATGNKWEVYSTLDEKPIGGAPGKLGDIEFDTTGKFKAGSPTHFAISQAITSGGSSPLNFDLDISESTQYASSSGVNFSRQDGYGPGSLKRIDVGSDGIITGTYDNDNKRVLGQITLSKFPNPQALNDIGNNLFLETLSSGKPISDIPNSRNLGSISQNSIEKSNVDVTKQLVALIIEQRGFQANVQTIKTEDQVQQSIMQIR